MLFNKEDFQPTFEINLVVKDALGNPTRQRKNHMSNNGYGIWEFWAKYQGKPKRHKKKIKNIQEGSRKGGQNKPPRTSRPSEPLVGQG